METWLPTAQSSIKLDHTTVGWDWGLSAYHWLRNISEEFLAMSFATDTYVHALLLPWAYSTHSILVISKKEESSNFLIKSVSKIYNSLNVIFQGILSIFDWDYTNLHHAYKEQSFHTKRRWTLSRETRQKTESEESVPFSHKFWLYFLQQPWYCHWNP